MSLGSGFHDGLYEVSEIRSNQSFGMFSADGPAAAIDAYCKQAGHAGKGEAEAAIGQAIGECARLVAIEI